MSNSRREFNFALAGAMLGFGTLPRQGSADPQAAGPEHGDAGVAQAAAVPPPYFFKNPTFEFVFLMSLGRTFQMAGNVGRTLYIGRQIEDGDFEGAFNAFKQAGDEARSTAEDSSSGGHRESARQAYLWAQNYYDCSTYFIDGSKDPGRFVSTWQLHYDCWSKATSLFDPAIEPISIPYEGTELRGFYFRAPGRPRRRALLILNNGSDGSLLDMWVQGGAGAVARGYDCLTFDGPGQGYALWKQKLFFRADWEKVITPVVDFALGRKEVDPRRIAIQGISQGGYWVPRAVAFEHRIAAAIADPGVVDVSTSWLEHFPKPMLELLKDGHKAEFDGYMERSLTPALRANLRFRMRPYGFSSYYDTFRATMGYNLRDVAAKIRCPLLITAPVNESFWPGQSKQLYELVTSPKKLVPFSVSEGADLHCEPKAFGLRDLRVFDWLDDTLQRI